MTRSRALPVGLVAVLLLGWAAAPAGAQQAGSDLLGAIGDALSDAPAGSDERASL